MSYDIEQNIQFWKNDLRQKFLYSYRTNMAAVDVMRKTLNSFSVGEQLTISMVDILEARAQAVVDLWRELTGEELI